MPPCQAKQSQLQPSQSDWLVKANCSFQVLEDRELIDAVDDFKLTKLTRKKWEINQWNLYMFHVNKSTLNYYFFFPQRNYVVRNAENFIWFAEISPKTSFKKWFHNRKTFWGVGYDFPFRFCQVHAIRLYPCLLPYLYPEHFVATSGPANEHALAFFDCSCDWAQSPIILRDMRGENSVNQ